MVSGQFVPWSDRSKSDRSTGKSDRSKKKSDRSTIKSDRSTWKWSDKKYFRVVHRSLHECYSSVSSERSDCIDFILNT